MSKTNRPIKTIKAGNVRAAIWANQGNDESRTFHTVTVTRSFKDGDEWRESTSFGRDDLPKLELVTRKAFEFIHLKAESRDGGESFADRVTGDSDASVAV